MLSEKQKEKIKEEETYRGEVKDKLKNKKRIGCLGTIGIIFIVGLFFSAMISVFNPSKQIERARQANTQNINNQYVFDIPSIVGKNLDEIITVLGKPEGQNPTALQIQQGIREWEKIFKKEGKELLVTYIISNGKIVDFFIPTDNTSGITKDKKHLLVIGNLNENDPNYRIEFVKAIKEPTSFTGIKIIPN